ncbi:hypothetical protein [Microcoleus sp. bin38.metabat.b11b12b14.051]|uniref:hypothetical protein n=1 Tax=Microcoleus sp. bin38.metabat.b11b12b14.051 TaxID=2742709 RepID=UPI0025D32C1D|nr:hypothetical protein [Microcoleus sp. bin38.metabat.b11b12b14.051]
MTVRSGEGRVIRGVGGLVRAASIEIQLSGLLWGARATVKVSRSRLQNAQSRPQVAKGFVSL